MHHQIDRPLDLLHNLKERRVAVHCRGYKDFAIIGKLIAFDIHINLVLEVKEDTKNVFRFVRGDNVVYVEESI